MLDIERKLRVTFLDHVFDSFDARKSTPRIFDTDVRFYRSGIEGIRCSGAMLYCK